MSESTLSPRTLEARFVPFNGFQVRQNGVIRGATRSELVKYHGGEQIARYGERHTKQWYAISESSYFNGSVDDDVYANDPRVQCDPAEAASADDVAEPVVRVRCHERHGWQIEIGGTVQASNRGAVVSMYGQLFADCVEQLSGEWVELLNDERAGSLDLDQIQLKPIIRRCNPVTVTA